MRHRRVMGTIGGMLAVFLIFAAPTAAQSEDCEVCDDSDITETECVEADWTQRGSTDCKAPSSGFCPDDPDHDCWGEDPHQASAFDVRPDGTLDRIATGGSDLSQEGGIQPVGIEALGFSSDARIMERNCKGLILDRLYGESTARALAAETELIVI